jgi:ribosomal protein S18 acetylase RimI-like enzyme
MIKIERLKIKDLSIFRRLLLKIFDEGFGYYPKNAQRYNKNHWSKKRLTEYLRKKDILMSLAWDGDEVVGYLIGEYYQSKKSSILWLGVVNAYRGRGIGTKLVCNWENWSGRKGASILKASTANFGNEKFYKSIGFHTSTKIVKNDWGMKKLVFIKKL